jgi:multidrug resistance protein, MATE family
MVEGMKHTELTVRNFAGLAVADFMIGSIAVGFGAIDLIMIAPKGVTNVAAVGQADLIVIGLAAFFGGAVDIFAARLAKAEGGGRTMRRLPTLGAAFALMLVAAGAFAILLAQLVEPFLTFTGQPAELVPLVDDYATLRLYAVPLMLAYAALSVACRIFGMKNAAVAILVVGFGANALLNWLFLYTGLQLWFASPAQAVAAATVVAQGVMLVCAIVVISRQLSRRDERFGQLVPGEVGPEFLSMARTAPGIGVRHLNDYAGSIIPLMFVGTLGVAQVAAFAIGAKIYTIFCRVPQSCVTSAFVYYGYELGREKAPEELKRSAHTLLRWAAVPTAIATVVVLATSPWLVRIFCGDDLDRTLAMWMLFAFMVTVPLYLFEAAYGEILTVHQRAGLLSVSSTVTTWFIMIPLAAFGVFVLHSAPWGIALGGVVSTAALVYVFWRALRRDHWSAGARSVEEAPA